MFLLYYTYFYYYIISIHLCFYIWLFYFVGYFCLVSFIILLNTRQKKYLFSLCLA